MIISYNTNIVNIVSEILNDIDPSCLPLEEMVKVLNNECDNIPVNWEINYEVPDEDETEWISGIANYNGLFGSLTLIFNAYNFEYDSDFFNYTILVMLCHETIHLSQYDKIGMDNLQKFKSGYQKGVDLFKKTGNENYLWREYYKDAHELMAYGHNLYYEILNSTNPNEALKSPEKYQDELLTYKSYRSVFPKNSKPIQKLLSYTYRYFQETV